MNKHFVLPALTFVIGGGIGVICGAKGFAAHLKRYLNSDEYKEYAKKEIDKIFDDLMKKD